MTFGGKQQVSKNCSCPSFGSEETPPCTLSPAVNDHSHLAQFKVDRKAGSFRKEEGCTRAKPLKKQSSPHTKDTGITGRTPTKDQNGLPRVLFEVRVVIWG